jgi:hypothetical protein
MHPLRLTIAGIALALMAIGTANAQDAVTATCKDGTSWSGAHRSGACRGHQGVQAFGAAATAGPATPATGAAAGSATPATGAPAASAAAMAPAPSRTPVAMAPAAGGGAGQVWVNSNSKVYHCQGDRYYGKTKAGEYMTEGAAKAAGDRPNHGKVCS